MKIRNTCKEKLEITGYKKFENPLPFAVVGQVQIVKLVTTYVEYVLPSVWKASSPEFLSSNLFF
jgi:hypothetical protein